MRLFALEDVNEDGATDVVWSVSTCKAENACDVQAYVYTWLDGRYQDWVDGRPQGRNARLLLEERGPGSGDELVIHEELPEAVTGAEVPAREYIWTSDAGAPYRLYDVVYEGTQCTRYALHEAEVALITGPRYGWKRALERLTPIAEGTNEGAPCALGKAREQEGAFLQGLAFFHQALAYAYAGEMEKARETIDLLSSIHDLAADMSEPLDPWANMGQAWWEALKSSQSIATACQAALAVADQYPDLLTRLNAYPVPNLLPDRREGLCPVLLR